LLADAINFSRFFPAIPPNLANAVQVVATVVSKMLPQQALAVTFMKSQI
jgi:hypothetical protein